MICAMLAAGWSYDLESVKTHLSRASPGSPHGRTTRAPCIPSRPWPSRCCCSSPAAATRCRRSTTVTPTARDPWLRAMGTFYRVACTPARWGGSTALEADLRAALREFRALGERWGGRPGPHRAGRPRVTFGPIMPRRSRPLRRPCPIGRELNAWGDLAYIEARLAINRARTGELARARAELDQAARAALSRRGQIDVDRWVTFMWSSWPGARAIWPRLSDYCPGSAHRVRLVPGDLVGAAAGADPGQARHGGPRARRRGALPGTARRRPRRRRQMDRAPAPRRRPGRVRLLRAPPRRPRPGPPPPSAPPTPMPTPRAAPPPRPPPPSPPSRPSSPPGCSARPTPSAAPSTSRAWTPRRPATPPGRRSARSPSTPPTAPPPTRPTRPPWT